MKCPICGNGKYYWIGEMLGIVLLTAAVAWGIWSIRFVRLAVQSASDGGRQNEAGVKLPCGDYYSRDYLLQLINEAQERGNIK